MRRPRGVGGSRRAIGLGTDLGTKRPICWLQPACRRCRDTHYRCTMSADDAQAELLPVSQMPRRNLFGCKPGCDCSSHPGVVTVTLLLGLLERRRVGPRSTRFVPACQRFGTL